MIKTADRHPWLADIRVGDVLRAPSGRLRVVRAVSRTCVVFSINHCSWTGRCYTVLCHADLITRGFTPTGKRRRLRKKIDADILREIENGRAAGIRPFEVGCCDVTGEF